MFALNLTICSSIWKWLLNKCTRRSETKNFKYVCWQSRFV